MRQVINTMVPQGGDAFEDMSPPGHDEVPNQDIGTHGRWKSQYPRGKRMNLTKARRTPQHALKSVSKLCSYFLSHDKRISHGNDGGVAISVILNEFRMGAGGESCIPHVREGSSSSRH